MQNESAKTAPTANAKLVTSGSEASQAGRYLRLRFRGDLLDRVEFRFNSTWKASYLQRGDERNPLNWPDVETAFCLCFLDYLIWESSERSGVFLFGAVNADVVLAKQLSSAIYQTNHKMHLLFFGENLKGKNEEPFVTHLIFPKIPGVSKSGKSKTIPLGLTISKNFLPADCVEIFLDREGTGKTEKINELEQFQELAKRIRSASGFLPEIKYPVASIDSGLEMHDAGRSELESKKNKQLQTVEIGKRVDWGEFLKQYPETQLALKQYPDQYSERYGQIKVLGMSRPVSLKDIYVDAPMADPDLLRRASILRDSKKTKNRGKNRDILPEDYSPKNGFEMANEFRYLNVLGQPGAGKSVFLRRIGLEALLPIKVRRYEHDCTPVFVELKHFNGRDLNLEKIITDEFATFGFPESFAEVALKNGKLLILLDGMDEVPSDNLNHVVNDVRRFVENNSSNRFIISSRTEFYQNWFSRFTDITVAEFRTDQIRSFIKNWFQIHNAKEKGKAKKFWEMLIWPGNKTFLELAGRPLLLVNFCRRLHGNARLPRDLDISYDEAVESVLKKWAAEKMILNNSIIGQESEIAVPTDDLVVFLK